MKKINRCKECDASVGDTYECDICEITRFNPVITIIVEDTEYHFCTKVHALRFLANEIRKETPVDDRFEYGNGEEHD